MFNQVDFPGHVFPAFVVPAANLWELSAAQVTVVQSAQPWIGVHP
jgi:hypothetical protein